MSPESVRNLVVSAQPDSDYDIVETIAFAALSQQTLSATLWQ
jgi:hypothetical protein